MQMMDGWRHDNVISDELPISVASDAHELKKDANMDDVGVGADWSTVGSDVVDGECDDMIIAPSSFVCSSTAHATIAFVFIGPYDAVSCGADDVRPIIVCSAVGAGSASVGVVKLRGIVCATAMVGIGEPSTAAMAASTGVDEDVAKLCCGDDKGDDGED